MNICPVCGKQISLNNHQRNQRGSSEEDHSHPKSMGGTDSPRNMNLICSECNMRKSNKHRSLNEFKNKHTKVSLGGKIIDAYNNIKNDDIVFQYLPNASEKFMGANPRRKFVG